MTSTDNPLGGPEKRGKRYWETSDFWKDAGERVVTMYLFSFSAIVVADGFEFTKKGFIVAGIAAGLSTVKALIGASRANSTTPVSIT